MNDIIYVLINEAMPGYVKIGKANNLEQRMRSLDNTSVPLPFECFYACRVNNADFVEKTLREIFSNDRVRTNREFFNLSPDRVLSALKLVESREDVTPNCDFVESEEDQKALNQARKRRSVFNFEMVDIPVRSEISYVHDENIKAIVIDSRKIEFNGEVTSLSTEAKKLLNSPNNVQGPLYWKYEGETLDARKRRFEEKEKQCLEVEE